MLEIKGKQENQSLEQLRREGGGVRDFRARTQTATVTQPEPNKAGEINPRLITPPRAPSAPVESVLYADLLLCRKLEKSAESAATWSPARSSPRRFTRRTRPADESLRGPRGRVHAVT